MSNANLHAANRAKNDEFYTELSEIEKELKNYSDKFKGKVVFCNCDDPFESNFVKYFLMHFNGLGLKTLYTTGYLISPIVDKEYRVGIENIPYSLCVTSTKEYLKGDQIDLDFNGAKEFVEKEGDRIRTKLLGDEKYVAGDFRSEESIEILKKSDIIVTNPPFSLFREYIAQLMEYKKKFLIIGNKNALTYKEIFPYIKNNEIWWGCTNPDLFRDEVGNLTNKVKGLSRWYTNLDHKKRHIMIPLDLGHKYYGYENQYANYDNYNAINIDKIRNIPHHFEAIMGVAISFMDKYCPEQFEIIKFRKGDDDKDLRINGKCPYFRILVKKRLEVEG